MELGLDLEHSNFHIMIWLRNSYKPTHPRKGRELTMKSDLSSARSALVTADNQQPVSSESFRWNTGPMERYTVQQAATLTGLSEHTLRYYEKIGLIKPVHRQESSGHRRYGPEDLTKLEALACLRATGMPIDQMRRYFELRSDGGDPANAASELQALLSEHLQELRQRMAALHMHMQYVEHKIDYWRAVEAHDEEAAANLAREAKELIRAMMLPPLLSPIIADNLSSEIR
jgi:DNA-binding transcriptional MerR regulator